MMRDVCERHGVKHREGSAAGAQCAAVAVAPVVTVEHVISALTVYGGRIALVRVLDRIVVVSGGWECGETLADAADLWNLFDHLGSLDAVAADLSMAVQWEAGQR